jgi:hypothetical protein
MASCDETPTSRYPTTEAATKDGAFRRGWLPEILQPDATDIYESHDIDSNRGYGSFALNSQLIQRLKSECRQLNATEFRCKEFQISVDLDKGSGSFRH